MHLSSQHKLLRICVLNVNWPVTLIPVIFRLRSAGSLGTSRAPSQHFVPSLRYARKPPTGEEEESKSIPPFLQVPCPSHTCTDDELSQTDIHLRCQLMNNSGSRRYYGESLNAFQNHATTTTNPATYSPSWF